MVPLKIRDEQMRLMGEARSSALRTRLKSYARNVLSARYAGMADGELDELVGWAMKRSHRLGLFSADHVERFVRFVLRHGRDFEQQLPLVHAITNDPRTVGAARIDALERLEGTSSEA
jgi:hypothetical protein